MDNVQNEEEKMSKAKTNNSIFLKFLREIILDKRYWLLSAFVIVMLLVGQNVVDNDQIDSEWVEKPQIRSDGTSYHLRDINSKPGEKYHLFFQVRLKNEAAKTLSDGNTNTLPVQEKLKVVLTNDLGANQVIDPIDIELNTDNYVNQEIFFTSDTGFQYLLVQKGEESSPSEVFIKNVRLVTLEGDRQLKQSFTGYYIDSQPIEALPLEKAHNYFSLNRKNIIVGETFKAEHEFLTGINLKLHFLGNGGNGNYKLFVSKISREGSKKILAENNLGEFSFNTHTAESNYQTDFSESIYHFPVTAKLIPGNEYFIGVDNKDVQINLIHNLQIFGSQDRAENSNGTGFAIKNRSEVNREIGDIYTKLYFADQPTYNGERVNFGDLFDDLGNGTGIYTYDSERAFSGFDLFESGDGIATYKINTIYPYNSLRFEYDINSSAHANIDHVYYSFDNKEWQEIPNNQQSAAALKFSQQIKGDGNTKMFYFKMQSEAGDVDLFPESIPQHQCVLKIFTNVKIK